jgi:spore coat protein U-like protein
MKRLLLVAILLTALAASESYAQSANANVNLTVNTALSVTKARDLTFGNQLAGATATVSPTNGPNAGNAAYFEILGSTGTPVTVTVTPSPNLTDSHSDNIPWTATYSYNTTNAQASATDVSGTSPFTETTNISLVVGFDLFVWVGGSVIVPNTAVAGQYSGTVTVAVAY